MTAGTIVVVVIAVIRAFVIKRILEGKYKIIGKKGRVYKLILQLDGTVKTYPTNNC